MDYSFRRRRRTFALCLSERVSSAPLTRRGCAYTNATSGLRAFRDVLTTKSGLPPLGSARCGRGRSALRVRPSHEFGPARVYPAGRRSSLELLASWRLPAPELLRLGEETCRAQLQRNGLVGPVLPVPAMNAGKGSRVAARRARAIILLVECLGEVARRSVGNAVKLVVHGCRRGPGEEERPSRSSRSCIPSLPSAAARTPRCRP